MQLCVYTKAEFPLSRFSAPLFAQEPPIKLCSSQQQSRYNWLTAGKNTLLHPETRRARNHLKAISSLQSPVIKRAAQKETVFFRE